MAQRFDFTGRAITFAEAVEEFPEIDHFHIVEMVNDREYVFHATVIDGRVMEGESDISDQIIAGNHRVVGDEWHER